MSNQRPLDWAVHAPSPRATGRGRCSSAGRDSEGLKTGQVKVPVYHPVLSPALLDPELARRRLRR